MTQMDDFDVVDSEEEVIRFMYGCAQGTTRWPVLTSMRAYNSVHQMTVRTPTTWLGRF